MTTQTVGKIPFIAGSGFIVLGLVVNLLGPIVIYSYGLGYYFAPDLLFPSAGYIFVGIGILTWGFYWYYGPRQFNKDVKSESSLQKELETAIQRIQAEPEKAKPAWDLARVRLELYFDRNLSQITQIFWLSVVVMSVGFLFILYGISRSFSSPVMSMQAGAETTAQMNTISQFNPLAPAIVGTIAGIITEFIGATFLFIYRSTIQQAENYTKTLERINSVGMAMQIMDTISAESRELQDRTKAEIVMVLLQQTQTLGNAEDTRQS